jgi:Ca-activated chloride channel family protein
LVAGPLMSAFNIQLAQPEWLLLFPALLVALALLRRYQPGQDDGETLGLSSQRNTQYIHPRLDLLQTLTKPKSGANRRPQAWWRWLALACMVAALSQPERVGERLPEPPQRRDIVFIVDTSVGMLLRDYLVDGKRIDRMTLLKGVLGRFVDGLQGDRLSVIVYADSPYTLVPLTYDHQLVRRMLARVETGVAGRTNAMGDAIALAVKEAGEAANRRRVLILFTDGARPTGRIAPAAAAVLAAEAKLTLYSVAIGAGSRQAEEHRATGLLYDTADRARLERIAERTGGRLYWAGDTRSLSDAIDRIAQSETDPVKSIDRHVHHSLYQWPLVLGLLILSWVQLRQFIREHS